MSSFHTFQKGEFHTASSTGCDHIVAEVSNPNSATETVSCPSPFHENYDH